MVGWDPSAPRRIVTGWEAWNPARDGAGPRRLHQAQDGDARPPVDAGAGHALLPEEVSAEILEDLRAAMGTDLLEEHHPEDDFLIDSAASPSRPTSTPSRSRRPGAPASSPASRSSGCSRSRPPRRCITPGSTDIGDGNFLVYDLGGGTFDVSIIRCLMGEYQVLGLDGDNYLGGDDFDRRLAEHLREHLVERGYALDLDVADDDDDRTRFELLRRVAQEVKEGLSQSQVQYVGRRDLFEDQQGQPVSLDMEVARASFEALIADLVEETIACCRARAAQERRGGRRDAGRDRPRAARGRLDARAAGGAPGRRGVLRRGQQPGRRPAATSRTRAWRWGRPSTRPTSPGSSSSTTSRARAWC